MDEQLIENRSGRGWDEPHMELSIEPRVTDSSDSRFREELIDDTRVPGVFSRVKRIVSGNREPHVGNESTRAEEPTCVDTIQKQDPVSLRIVIPWDYAPPRDGFPGLIADLAFSSRFYSFELIADRKEIAIQFTSPEGDHSLLRSLLLEHLSGAGVLEIDQLTGLAGSAQEPKLLDLQDFGLQRHWVLPLKTTSELDTDPLSAWVAATHGLGPGEFVCLQVFIAPGDEKWKTEALARLHLTRRGALRVIGKVEQALALKKLKDPLFASTIRLVAGSGTIERSRSLVNRTRVFLRQFAVGTGNELVPLKGIQGDQAWLRDRLLSRGPTREGMLLTDKELAAIVRLPDVSSRSSRFSYSYKRTRPVPKEATSGDLKIGFNDHLGAKVEVMLPSAAHKLVIGGTGMGKSMLLLRMMVETARSGSGFALFDPHGDLVDDVTANLPEDRLQDVILFDPSNTSDPIGFNLFQAQTTAEKSFISSDVVATFRRFATSWGDVMESVLANSTIALLESDGPKTLEDLRRFLVDDSVRTEILATVKDRRVRDYFGSEYKLIAKRSLSSVLIRLDTFLRQKLVRNIVGGNSNCLNFSSAINEKRILLVKLAEGLIGESNASLLGTLMISKLYQTALTRQSIDQQKRALFSCFIDEAAHYAGIPSMSLILSNLRKYGISLTLATQSFSRLRLQDTALADSILTNVGARILFRLGEKDADLFQSGLTGFDSISLQNLSVGEAVVRIGEPQSAFNLTTLPVSEVTRSVLTQRIEQIKRNNVASFTREEPDVTPEKIVGSSQDLAALEPSKSAAVDRPSPSGKDDRSTQLDQGPTQPVRQEDISVQSAPTKGQGSEHHRKLQALIARVAESYGYEAKIECKVDHGCVDVAIDTGEKSIACEISVTTNRYEAVNIRKCLTAGFDEVVVIAANRKKVKRLEGSVKAALAGIPRARYTITDLGSFLSYLGRSSNQDAASGNCEVNARMTVEEASKLLGVSSSTLYRWVRLRRVPFYKVGRQYRFDRNELLLLGRHLPETLKKQPGHELKAVSFGRRGSRRKKKDDERYRKMLGLD